MGARLTFRHPWESVLGKGQTAYENSGAGAMSVANAQPVNADEVAHGGVSTVEPPIARLFDVCGARAYSLATHLLDGDRQRAEDIVSAVFVEISRAFPDTGYQDPIGLSRLTLERVRRRCLESMSATGETSTRPPHSVTQMRPLGASAPTPAEVRVALGSLPVEQRRALELAYFDGRTSAEIASITGATKREVNRQLRFALHQVAAMLSADEVADAIHTSLHEMRRAAPEPESSGAAHAVGASSTEWIEAGRRG